MIIYIGGFWYNYTVDKVRNLPAVDGWITGRASPGVGDRVRWSVMREDNADAHYDLVDVWHLRECQDCGNLVGLMYIQCQECHAKELAG